MKRLLLILWIVLQGCGAGDKTEGNDFDLFTEYYAECIRYCEADIEWLDACGYTPYDVEDCVRQAWDDGCGNWWCVERIVWIDGINYATEIAAGNREQMCTSYDSRTGMKLPQTELYCH